MPRLQALVSQSTPDFPVLARLLWQCLALGVLAVTLLPAARGDSALLGSLPFWLLAAPAAALLALHRQGVRSYFLIAFRKVANDSGRKCALTPVSRLPSRRPAQAKRSDDTNPERPTASAQAA